MSVKTNDVEEMNIKNIKPIKISNILINQNSVDAFDNNIKQLNDSKNKLREHIISFIINDKIPANYFNLPKWNNLKTAIFNYFDSFINVPYNIECITKGGRKNKYDFKILITDEHKKIFEYLIEFKYNIKQINQAPQFVSPMKPSQYMTISYEEYYYKNYLPKIADYLGVKNLPNEDIYLNQIHSTKPKCMEIYQKKYYQGCRSSSQYTSLKEDVEFYNFCKKISRESITTFLNNADLNHDMLSKYLFETQDNKIYMLYYNGIFYKEEILQDNYKIISVDKNPEKHTFTCLTIAKNKIKILLRWKNGNGIAFPAFQISS
jgi:hypothetical protein